jgi:hypothetical protein
MNEQNTGTPWKGLAHYGGTDGIEVLESEQPNYIKDWVFIPRVLSDAEMNQVYNDLAAKWGIPLLDCEEVINEEQI